VFHVDKFDSCCQRSQKSLAKLQLLSVLLVCFHHDFWTVQAVLVVVNVVQFALNGPSSRLATCFCGWDVGMHSWLVLFMVVSQSFESEFWVNGKMYSGKGCFQYFPWIDSYL